MWKQVTLCVVLLLVISDDVSASPKPRGVKTAKSQKNSEDLQETTPTIVNPRESCQKELQTVECERTGEKIPHYFDTTEQICKPFDTGYCGEGDNSFQDLFACQRVCPDISMCQKSCVSSLQKKECAGKFEMELRGPDCTVCICYADIMKANEQDDDVL